MKRITADPTAKQEPVGQMWKTGSLFLSKRNGVETMQFICYTRCGTCQKAKKYLTEHEIPYEERDIKSENPTEEELNIWIEKSGLPSRKFFNTSGKQYKEMELSKKLPDMTKEEQVRLLASDGMLVKRPILVGDHGVLVGFREADWEAALQGKQ